MWLAGALAGTETGGDGGGSTAFYPPAFNINPAPDLIHGYANGNGLPLLHLSNTLAARKRARRTRPDRDEAPVEEASSLDTQVAAGNDWFSQLSVPGLRGSSLNRFAKQQADAPRRVAGYLQAGQGWAPGDFELAGPYGRTNAAEAMAAGMVASSRDLERAAAVPPPPDTEPPSPQGAEARQAADVQRVLAWRQRMQDPSHAEWIRRHLADHPLDPQQMQAMAQAKSGAPAATPGQHADGSPPDPWEMAPAPPRVDLAGEEPPLVRLQREQFVVPTGRGEKVDTVLDHQQL